MRLSIFALLGLTIFLTSCNSTKSISNFYHAHKREKGTVNFRIPGFLIWMGTGIAYESIKEPETRAGMKIAKKIKGLRFMVNEDANTIPQEEVHALLANLRQDKFEDLLYVKDQETTFTLMIKEKKEKIKRIFLLVQEPDEFVLMEVKTSLKIKDIQKLIKSFQKEIKIEKPKEKIKLDQA
jgi:hypothetical protein